jgi:hypothetical protein
VRKAIAAAQPGRRGRLVAACARDQILEMATTGLRYEDQLEGASNFLPWKARIMFLLRENGLWSHANTAVTAPTDPAELAKHEAREAKAMWMILDSVRDHLVPHLSEKKSANVMFSTLTNLFQSNNENQKMVLRDRLRNTKMSKTDSVTSYLTRITQVRDQLGAVDETVTNVELVRVALNGFTKPWTSFIEGICAREKLSDFNRLWDDCIQEETRREALGGPQEDGDEENLALSSQAKKGKGKVRKNTGGDSSSQAGTGKDLSKVKCFHCHKKGHYASQCPERKKGGNRTQPEVVASTKAQVDEFAKKFEHEFLLVSHLSSGTISVGAWLLDSGATCHMTGA